MRRRRFVQLAGAAGLAASGLGAQSSSGRPVRIGVVGVGSRGTSHLRTLLDIPAVEVPAVCDINEERLRTALDIVAKAGHKRPEGYSRGVDDWKRLAARDDLDAVINATPWELHTPISVAAMQAGKYAATEVPAAITLEQAWDLVRTSERTGKPCMMLENVNYFRNVMLVLNMIRQGVFGEVLHCAGGYQHDVRYVNILPSGELSWRGVYAARRNANLYPTHPIGPIAWWMDINRGDRFEYLVSMSTPSRGLNHYAAKKFGPQHPSATRKYALGDVNTCLIKTARGCTVTLYYDPQLSRPYDLGFRVQGVKGIYSGTLDKFFIEAAEGAKREEWEDPAPYYEKYEHPLWKTVPNLPQRYAHGAADYFVLAEFVKAVRNGTQTPIDVYDSATWSAILPLTEKSNAAASARVDFPDFTGGKWKTARPVTFDA